MGNCGLKPKVLSETGAPPPEEQEISLLQDQKINAAKSLINLFLQVSHLKMINTDNLIQLLLCQILNYINLLYIVCGIFGYQEKADKTLKEDEKTTPEKIPVTEDLQTALAEAESPVIETKAPAVVNVEAVHGQKVIDDATVKETETEAKPEEEVTSAVK